MVGFLFGQFVKPDIRLVVDVVDNFDFFLVARFEVNQFKEGCIEADDESHIHKNIPMKNC